MAHGHDGIHTNIVLVVAMLEMYTVSMLRLEDD